MTNQEKRDQLARLQATLAAFPDFIYVPPKAKYVPMGNPEDGEVELNDDLADSETDLLDEGEEDDFSKS